MANVTPRFLWQNFVQLSNTVITVSSEDLSFPRRWMLDPMKTMAFRTKVGWNVVAGFNDKIDFNLAGAKVATLTAGNYATGSLMAAQVQTALAAAYATGTWTVTYSGTTFMFTIVHSITAHTLLPVTGTNALTTALTDLGFAADVSSNVTHTGSAVYQSRGWVKFDLGSAMTIDAVCIAGLFAMTTGGTLKIQGNATDAWTAPSYDQTFAAASQVGGIAAHWASSSQTYRWWRIVLNDPFKSSGYLSVGVPFLGSYIQLAQGPKNKGAREGHERYAFSQTSDGGGHFVDAKLPGVRKGWDFEHLSDTEKASLLLMQATIDDRSQFYAMDPTSHSTDVEYGAVRVGEFVHGHGGGPSTAYWSVSIQTSQQLQ